MSCAPVFMLDCFIASYFSQIRKKIWSPKHFFYFYIIFYVFSDFGPKYGDCTNLLAVRVTRWDRREPCRMSGQVHWGPLHTQNCAVLKKISSCNMAPLTDPRVHKYDAYFSPYERRDSPTFMPFFALAHRRSVPRR